MPTPAPSTNVRREILPIEAPSPGILLGPYENSQPAKRLYSMRSKPRMSRALSRPLESMIHLIRGQKVMLDEDLAELYGVETRVLNQAVRRNQDRFPGSFMFRLTSKEQESLTSQIVISKR